MPETISRKTTDDEYLQQYGVSKAHQDDINAEAAKRTSVKNKWRVENGRLPKIAIKLDLYLKLKTYAGEDGHLNQRFRSHGMCEFLVKRLKYAFQQQFPMPIPCEHYKNRYFENLDDQGKTINKRRAFAVTQECIDLLKEALDCQEILDRETGTYGRWFKNYPDVINYLLSTYDDVDIPVDSKIDQSRF